MNKEGSLWFLAGLGCGAVVGMLYAPLPGTQARAIAAAKAKQAQGLFARCGGESAGNAIERASKAVSEARQARERIHRALDARRLGLHKT